MENFKLAQSEFKRLNFYKAVEYYLKSLEEEDLGPSNKILCCEKIISISKKTGLKIPDNVLKMLGLIHLEKGKKQSAAHIFESLLSKNRSSENFNLVYTTLLELGELKKVKEVAQGYLDFLRERKLSYKGLNFLKELPPGILCYERQFFFKIHFFSFIGNFKELAKLCFELKEEGKSDKVKNLEILLGALDQHGTLWKGNKELMGNVLGLFLGKNIIDFILLKRERKFIIKLAFDALFDKNLQTIGLKLIEIYARNFERKKLGYSAADLLENMEGIEFFSRMKDEKCSEMEDIDLGDDLHGKVELSGPESLEKNIRFLRNVHKNKEAYESALKLKKLDPENPILKDFFKAHIAYEQNSSEGHKVIDSLLQDIEPYTSKRKDHFEQDYKNKLKKIILTMPIEKLERYCFDLVCALNYLEFPDVSIEVLMHLKNKVNSHDTIFDKVDVRQRGATETYFQYATGPDARAFGNPLERRGRQKREQLRVKNDVWPLGHQYLLVETFILAKRPYDALDIIDDVMGNYPMLDREKMGFAYLKGEIFLSLESQKKALEIFKFVDRIQPGFRLVKERIKRLEENQ